MTKADLIKAISEECEMSEKTCKKVFDATLHQITESLAKGESIQLVGFGTFSVYVRNERESRNPRTKETMIVPEKRVPKFKPGATLKNIVNNDDNKKESI